MTFAQAFVRVFLTVATTIIVKNQLEKAFPMPPLPEDTPKC